MSMQILIKRPELVTRTIAGEVVIMIPEKGRVLGLNEVGSFIWELIDGSNSIEDIRRALCREFEVDDTQAAVDINDFILVLKEKNLLITA